MRRKGDEMSEKSQLQDIVGNERVIDDPVALEEYSRDHSFVSPRKPSLVVKPKTGEEIRQVVKLANKEAFPLIPVSSGPPRFHGDTVPEIDGAVIVDLQDMKSMSWINRRNRVAVIEAGVTFGELEPELEKQGLRALMPLCPKPAKSVIASHWEREPFTTPRFQWDGMDPIACTELILGDGNSLMAGEVGWLPGTLEEQRERGHAHKAPFGVLTMNMKKLGGGSQGTMGIVPWASLRCELLPEQEQLFFVQGQELGELTAPAHYLIYTRLADHLFILNSLNLASMLRKAPDEILKLRDSLPPWLLIFSLAGYGVLPREMFEYKRAEIEAANFSASSSLPGVTPEEIWSLLRKPSEEPYWKLRLKGDSRDLFFQTSLAKSPEFVEVMVRMAGEAGYPVSDMGVYIQPQMQGVCCHLEFDLNLSPESQDEAQKVKALIKQASEIMFSSGAYFSRPYGEWSDMVYSRYTQMTNYLNRLRKIFDPKGIMSPGKLCFK
jgi:FAD/FMN-containing dehydrogenase